VPRFGLAFRPGREFDTGRGSTKLDIVNWIERFYNGQRLHSSVDYRSPANVESSLMAP
jgi:transposase InsO family protein